LAQAAWTKQERLRQDGAMAAGCIRSLLNRHIQHRHGTTHQGTTQHELSGRLWPKKCSSPGASCCLMTSGVNWEAWHFGSSRKFHSSIAAHWAAISCWLWPKPPGP
jgi:hypothetical protein